MRDSLSLLDQAIAHAAGGVRAEAVRQMLGLADRTRGDRSLRIRWRAAISPAPSTNSATQYDVGADPIVVLSDLAEFVNFVTRVKIVPATADNVAFSETERLRARDFASKLSMRVLSRMWQMLLKGITEAQAATRPAAAAEMVLVRIAYVADMPTPDEAIRMIEQNGGAVAGRQRQCAVARHAGADGLGRSSAPARAAAAPRGAPEASARPQMAAAPAPEAQAAPVRRISSFPELVALAGEKRDIMTKVALETDVRLVRIEDGRLEIALERNAQRSLVNDLSRKLEQWTNRRWTVIVSNEAGQATLREQESRGEERARESGRGRSARPGSARALSRRQARRSAQACRGAAGIRCQCWSRR